MQTSQASVPRTTAPLLRRLGVVAGATGAAVITWFLIEALGHDIVGPAFGDSPPMDVSLAPVTVSAVLAGLAATAALAAFERFSSRPRRSWRVLAGLVFLVSLGGPLGGTGVEAYDRLALLLLHAVVATGLIVWLPGGDK
ncbi:MAG TPA: DUF6069 family protein [Acidimicrobiia bacterium]|nr:DUF6069 family protein [Acidimicrobiia bacterium]